MREIAQFITLALVVWAAGNALEQDSIGWSTVAICGTVFLSTWGIGDQIARGLNRLDEIKRGLERSGLLREDAEEDIDDDDDI